MHSTLANLSSVEHKLAMTNRRRARSSLDEPYTARGPRDRAVSDGTGPSKRAKGSRPSAGLDFLKPLHPGSAGARNTLVDHRPTRSCDGAMKNVPQCMAGLQSRVALMPMQATGYGPGPQALRLIAQKIDRGIGVR